MVKELNEGGANVFLGALMTSLTGDVAIHCGRLLSLPAVAVLNSCHWAQPAMTWPASIWSSTRQSATGRQTWLWFAVPYQQDGSRAEATLRPNGRSQIRSCRRWLCSKRRSIQEVLSRTERSRQDTTRRCIHARFVRPAPKHFITDWCNCNAKVKVEKFFGGVNKREKDEWDHKIPLKSYLMKL